MANLTRVLTALYCEPWLIQPSMHRQLCDITWAHVTGSAHDGDGILAKFDDEVKRDRIGDVARDGNVAILSVGGVIGRKFSGFLNSSGVTSVDVLQRIVEEARTDPSIEGMVLDVDSPGGTVTGTPEAAETLADFSREKPLVAYTSGLMASAAYWLSAPADAIFAAPSADVGSIGVYAAMLDVTRAMENQGVHVELFKQGKFKAMGMPGTSLTDEQREFLQERVDEIGDWFRGYVQGNRPAVERDAMEGQTFMGENALEVGLVDHIGTLADAVDHVRTNAAR